MFSVNMMLRMTHVSQHAEEDQFWKSQYCSLGQSWIIKYDVTHDACFTTCRGGPVLEIAILFTWSVLDNLGLNEALSPIFRGSHVMAGWPVMSWFRLCLHILVL
jgi:hypothetical protein